MRLIVIDNFPQIASRFAHTAEVIPAITNEAVVSTAEVIGHTMEEYLRDRTPVAPVDGGDLRDSTRSHIAFVPGGFLATVTQDTPPELDQRGLSLPWLLTEGTAPHSIDPLHPKEALFWPGAAHPVGHVEHPGTSPNPYITDAMEAASPVIADELAIAGFDITEAVVAALHA